MKTRRILGLGASLLLAFLVLFGLRAAAVSTQGPTGTLNVVIVDRSSFLIRATGTYTGARDWEACVYWGHDASIVCFPGASGTFSETHVMPGWGTYTVTLTVGDGSVYPYTTSKVVAFQKYEIYLPTVVTIGSPRCTITNQVGSNHHWYTTTLSWESAPAQWHMFEWGDSSSVGFWGPSGSSTWNHVYNPGSWTQRAVFSDGTEGCSIIVIVP